MNERIQKTIQHLNERQFQAHYVKTKEEVLPLIKTMIKEGDMISNGGSVTLNQLGIIDYIKANDYNYLSLEGLQTPEEKKEMTRKRFFADTFLCSANAICVDGRIFQEDGASTRVAPMIYGPDQVIIVAGVNKIVDTEGQAKARIKKIAPINCKKIGFDTPCTKDGFCHDCKDEHRSCCTSVTLNFSRIPNRIKVIIVDEDLGL